MGLRFRSTAGGSVQLDAPAGVSSDILVEVPAIAGAKLLSDKTPGTVLQVVEAEFVSGMSTTSTSYADTGISLSITPKNTTSKILLVGRIPIRLMGYTYGSIRWQRNNSTIYDPPTGYEFGITTGNADSRTVIPYTLLDMPNTTSQVTYKAQVVSYNGATVEVMPANHRAAIALMEIAA